MCACTCACACVYYVCICVHERTIDPVTYVLVTSYRPWPLDSVPLPVLSVTAFLAANATRSSTGISARDFSDGTVSSLAPDILARKSGRTMLRRCSETGTTSATPPTEGHRREEAKGKRREAKSAPPPCGDGANAATASVRITTRQVVTAHLPRCLSVFIRICLSVAFFFWRELKRFLSMKEDADSAQARTVAIQTLLERECRFPSFTRHVFFGSPFASHACSS